MRVEVWDHYGSQQYVNWVGNEFMGLTFTNEIPGGMISASFDVPAKYHLPYQWADVFNRVFIYNGPTLVWSGLIYALERYWGDESGIRVDCVGNVARLGMWHVSTNLDNEKGSTWLNASLVSYFDFYGFLSIGEIDTTDYTIPGVREYQPVVSMREAIDDIQSFNLNTHVWYVWGDSFYFVPLETDVSYVTSTEHSTGSLRQEIGELSNVLWYTYRDAAGLVTLAATTDTETRYPTKASVDSYPDNMTAAQALQLATASLEGKKVLGATAQIEVSKAQTLGGADLHPSEIMPGKLMHISRLVTAKASPAEVFIDNDVDTFMIKSVTYNHDAQTCTIAPGRLPHTLPRSLAGR